MIKFKQKECSGKAKVTETIKYVKQHPTLPIAVASLGIAGTNLAVNARRHKEASEYQEKQLNAMNKLTKALGKVDDTISQQSQNIKKDESKKPFFQFKKFSIEEGGYKGGKRTPGKGNYLVGAGVGAATGSIFGGLVGHADGKAGKFAAIGGIIGAGVGALSTWLNNIADKSLFNSGFADNSNSYNLIQEIEDLYAPKEPDENEEETTVTETDSWGRTITRKKRVQFNKKKVVSPKGVIYDVDSDPKKYPLSVLFRGHVLMMYVNNPSRQELGLLNRVLDAYCFAYKKADYAAEQINNNVYVVELYVIENTLGNIAKSLIDVGFKLNILTGNKFGVGKR